MSPAAPPPDTPQPRRALPPSAGRGRARWWILGGALAALVALVAAALVVVPWYMDGTRAPYHATIAAGRAHTCAITAGGGVRCWGDNAFGQLGDGTQTPSSRPVPVEGLDAGVVALSGSGNHTCAVTEGGAVRCWGDNAFGQLGNGATEPSPRPVDVQGLDAGVLAVSAGPEHTCALDGSRAVRCWGANALSQLGSGDSVDRSTPIAVADLPARVTGVSVGSGFTCVVFTGRTVRCWGDNSDGQLGLGDTEQRISWAPLTALPRSSFVSAGDTHACAVAGDGSVWCWGGNNAGQLGDGQVAPNSLAPASVPGVTGASVVSAGYDRTCAVTASGSVTCWGGLLAEGAGSEGDEGGESGEAGEGSATAPGPAAVEGLAGARDVSVGAFHACAAVADGVRCWGLNTSGQLGDGTTTDSLTPVAAALAG